MGPDVSGLYYVERHPKTDGAALSAHITWGSIPKRIQAVRIYLGKSLMRRDLIVPVWCKK
jgi:hypothetical protein